MKFILTWLLVGLFFYIIGCIQDAIYYPKRKWGKKDSIETFILAIVLGPITALVILKSHFDFTLRKDNANKKK